MENHNCCNKNETLSDSYEIIKIAKTCKVCSMCEDFSTSQSQKENLTAIISCEGACLRGEVSRRVANEICFNIYNDKTARVCLGGAFTKDTGQRNMVKNAKRVVILEGCYINCASRMIQGVLHHIKPEVIILDNFYEFDKSLFGINEVTENELKVYTKEAINNITKILKLNQ